MSVAEVPWNRLERPQSGMLNTLSVGGEGVNHWFWIKTKSGEYGLAMRVLKKDENSIEGADLSSTKRLKGLKVGDKGSVYIGVVIGEPWPSVGAVLPPRPLVVEAEWKWNSWLVGTFG